MQIHGGEGGGLNCEAKAQVLVVTPSPLFFFEVGHKKGGHNSGAVRYYKINMNQCLCLCLKIQQCYPAYQSKTT